MNSPRGLTLIEVLLAVLLITITAATCLPIIQSAVTTLREARADAEPYDLSRLADAWMEDHLVLPSKGGAGDALPADVSWPDDPGRAAVHVELMPRGSGSGSGEESIDHAWVLFTCGDQRVVRWIVMEKEEQTDEGQEP